jgi:hypothetical protein
MDRQENPLEMTPREAWLEVQYSRLRAENEWLRQSGPRSYSVLEPADTLYVSPKVATLHLAAECHAHKDRKHGGLHVRVRSDVREYGEMSLRYFVSDESVMTARHSASIMADMHKKVVFDIGRHLWDDK